MPKLLSQTEVAIEWSDLAKWQQVKQPKSVHKRSSGVHLSGVIKHVLKELKLLEPHDQTDEMPLCMCVGMAWENWVVGLMGEEFCWQPNPLELDGVHGSPDGSSYQEPHISCGYTIKEFKATWKSRRNYGDILKQKIWVWQLAGYCKMAYDCHHARLHVLWVNGDYRPPTPKYCRYLVEFEQRELDEFWANVVMKNKDKAMKEDHA